MNLTLDYTFHEIKNCGFLTIVSQLPIKMPDTW